MPKKVIVVIFFLIVFGLPVGWYLILQVFGENRFDLPELELLDSKCIDVPGQAYLAIDSAHFLNNRTEWRRIKKHFKAIKQTDVTIVNNLPCNEKEGLFFVDENGVLRGEYFISREETDRLLTEVDIYLHNLKRERGEAQ